VTYNAKVSKIAQDDKGVAVTYADTATGNARRQADWCVCTIPLSASSTRSRQRQVPTDARRDRRGAIFGPGEDRPRDEAPLLGGG
jgi:monoamine oxidase